MHDNMEVVEEALQCTIRQPTYPYTQQRKVRGTCPIVTIEAPQRASWRGAGSSIHYFHTSALEGYTRVYPAV